MYILDSFSLDMCSLFDFFRSRTFQKLFLGRVPLLCAIPVDGRHRNCPPFLRVAVHVLNWSNTFVFTLFEMPDAEMLTKLTKHIRTTSSHKIKWCTNKHTSSNMLVNYLSNEWINSVEVHTNKIYLQYRKGYVTCTRQTSAITSQAFILSRLCSSEYYVRNIHYDRTVCESSRSHHLYGDKLKESYTCLFLIGSMLSSPNYCVFFLLPSNLFRIYLYSHNI